MQPADNLVASSTEAERKRIIGDLACKHGLSKDRAQMLMDKSAPAAPIWKVRREA